MCDMFKASQQYLSQVIVIFQKYPTKIVSYDFRRVTEVSDKIDVEPLETLKN